MLKKNIEKEQRKNRKLWTGYYTRKTPTKRDKELKMDKKYTTNIKKQLENT